MDIQRQFVATLTSEIGMLDAVLFEKLCHHLICAIEKDQSLIYRGSNFDGKPVGYTVDSFSFGGKITGGYSTELLAQSKNFTCSPTKFASMAISLTLKQL